MDPLWLAGIIWTADVDPKPRDVDGFVVFRICTKADDLPDNYPDWVYIVPSAVISVSAPHDAPKGCAAIRSANGHRLYVYGTSEEVTRKLADGKKKER